ncbi:MAG: hypothetical protein AB7U07_13165 [Thermoleophilia bacterium]
MRRPLRQGGEGGSPRLVTDVPGLWTSLASGPIGVAIALIVFFALIPLMN